MHNKLVLSGFVLHKRAYRETSLLVDFFTLEYGRVSAVAKGARGASRSDRKSLLQGFQLLAFELNGRSSLKNLGLLEAKQNPIPLKGKALYCGFYINEMLSRALPEAESSEEIFAHYTYSLTRLSELNADLSDVNQYEPILREFELNLLKVLGYLPDFYHDCETTEAIQDNLFYAFDPLNGFYVSHAQAKFPIKGDIIRAIATKNFSGPNGKQVRQAAKHICRNILKELIGDKPIKSRELFL